MRRFTNNHTTRRPRIAWALVAAVLCFYAAVTEARQVTVNCSTSSPSLDTRQLFSRAVSNIPPYECELIGECQACNTLQIETEDHCKETHNRQRILCKFVDPKDDENEEFKIHLPKFQSCPRVRALEARRFANFVSTNVFLALFSGVLMVWRKRKLAAAQYRRMARRIGIA